MSLLRRIIVCILLLCVTTGGKAQSVYAQVSAKQVQVGEAFEYAVVANITINNITPPSFQGFAVTGGPNQSSSMQWVNGQTSMQLTVTWQLVAQKEGKYTIGKSIVIAGNQKIETQ